MYILKYLLKIKFYYKIIQIKKGILKMSYSKLIIKNFGKIKEAKIELSNLILFIGDNNSGKSYLMTLIYGLMKYSDDIVNIIFKDKEFIYSLEEYKKIEDIVVKYVLINENINSNEAISNIFKDFGENKKNIDDIKKIIIFYQKMKLIYSIIF